MYQPFDFDQAVEEMTRELVISKVRQVPAPYQSMYIYSCTQADEYTILGVASVAAKNIEAYLLVNRNNHFISGSDTFEEVVKLSREDGMAASEVQVKMAASEVQVKVEITPPFMSQEELQQLKDLLNKARLILDSPEANVFVCNDDENTELVLFGECSKEGVYRTVSSQGVSDDGM